MESHLVCQYRIYFKPRMFYAITCGCIHEHRVAGKEWRCLPHQTFSWPPRWWQKTGPSNPLGLHPGSQLQVYRAVTQRFHHHLWRIFILQNPFIFLCHFQEDRFCFINVISVTNSKGEINPADGHGRVVDDGSGGQGRVGDNYLAVIRCGQNGCKYLYLLHGTHITLCFDEMTHFVWFKQQDHYATGKLGAYPGGPVQRPDPQHPVQQ